MPTPQPKRKRSVRGQCTRTPARILMPLQATQHLNKLKSEIRDLESLKAVALEVERVLSEIREAKRDVQDLERQLQSTGSARTADDVQTEIKTIGERM